MVNASLISRNKKNLVKINRTELARAIGRSRTWVSLVLNGHKKSIATRRAIAEALNVPYVKLWGKESKKAA